MSWSYAQYTKSKPSVSLNYSLPCCQALIINPPRITLIYSDDWLDFQQVDVWLMLPLANHPLAEYEYLQNCEPNIAVHHEQSHPFIEYRVKVEITKSLKHAVSALCTVHFRTVTISAGILTCFISDPDPHSIVIAKFKNMLNHVDDLHWMKHWFNCGKPYLVVCVWTPWMVWTHHPTSRRNIHPKGRCYAPETLDLWCCLVLTCYRRVPGYRALTECSLSGLSRQESK